MKLSEFIITILSEMNGFENGNIDFDIVVFPEGRQIKVATDHLAGSTAQGLSRIKFSVKINATQQSKKEGSDE